MAFYTYIYREPCGDPFYVGKGTGKRAFFEKNKTVEGRIRKLKSQGMSHDIEIINTTCEIAALWLERVLIKAFGRKDLGEGTLLNLTDGGEGSSGWKQSPETVAKRVAKNTGKKRSPELKAKMKAMYASPEYQDRFKKAGSRGQSRPEVRAASAERMRILRNKVEV